MDERFTADIIDNEKIDEKKLVRMQTRIITLESENMRTHEKTDSQMIDAIKKIIEEELRKCY